MGKWTIPFIVGIILAYCLHYPSQLLSQKLKISSTLSASIILIFIISIFTLIFIFLIPSIQNATLVLLKKLAIFLNSSSADSINEFVKSILLKCGINKTIDIGNGIQNYVTEITHNIPKYLYNFINTGKSIVYTIIFMCMIPIITFYLLKDWSKFEKYFIIVLRKFTSDRCIELLLNINKKLGEYIKGQLLVCCVLSIIYTILIKFIGTNEYVMCGIFSGFISIAPFFGPCIGLAITLAMSVDDFMFLYQYLITISLYLVVPFIDSNFITPKLIGDKLGIHPFWMLFSICASMSVLGTPGIFLSIPITVICTTIFKLFFNKQV
ncbi:MAG: AI-2E family transporter [Alphaproteobacteria bacterium]|nr:AI-2E family transporter [Alphaproteobacteria bacterium]